ncbi:MAG: hypothetical protein K2X69_15030 [Silvanigrellaceae bacterium]|jgi:hypothetical protein|nr:hypothetical protein [Silvanigrellaceae bacterium]
MTNQITYEIISLSTLAASSKFESAQDNLKNSKPFILIRKEGDTES